MQVPLEVEGLAVSTQFFRAYGQVVQGDQVYDVSTLIYRETNGDTTVINRNLAAF